MVYHFCKKQFQLIFSQRECQPPDHDFSSDRSSPADEELSIEAPSNSGSLEAAANIPARRGRSRRSSSTAPREVDIQERRSVVNLDENVDENADENDSGDDNQDVRVSNLRL